MIKTIAVPLQPYHHHYHLTPPPYSTLVPVPR